MVKMDDMLKAEQEACPKCDTHGTVKFGIHYAPGITDSFKLGRIKPDSVFRELLTAAKKSAGSLENMGSSHV